MPIQVRYILSRKIEDLQIPGTDNATIFCEDSFRRFDILNGRFAAERCKYRGERKI